MNNDKWSSGANSAIEILLTKHQGRTSLGGVLGSAIAFIVDLFSPVLYEITIVNFEKMPFYGWIPIGILIMHIPTIFNYLSTKPSGDESVDETISLIKKGNFSEQEKRKLYRDLIEVHIDRIRLSQRNQNNNSGPQPEE